MQKKKKKKKTQAVVVGNDNRTQTPKQPQSTYLPNIFNISNGPL